MVEELIALETARLAKDKGFDIPTLEFFGKDREKGWVAKLPDWYDIGYASYNKDEYTIARPSQSLLQRWLREKHKINIDSATTYSNKYGFIIYRAFIPDPKYITDDFDSYEEGLEHTLLQALKFI